MTTKAVGPEFLQKVVGFAEATNVMMKQAEDQRASIREAAEGAVDELEKAGKLEEGQTREELIEGFVNKPEMALKLAASLVKEAKESQSHEQKPAEGADKEASIGGAAEPEDPAARSAESKTAAALSPAVKTKQSDEVWNSGFGFGG